MQNCKIQWVISLILVLFGCTTGETQLIRENISIKAVSVPEGIRLSFDHIPINLEF
jgi:hypothetical protein